MDRSGLVMSAGKRKDVSGKRRRLLISINQSGRTAARDSQELFKQSLVFRYCIDYCFVLKRFNLTKMSTPKVVQLMVFLLISQQAKFIHSSPLNLPPIRDYTKYKRIMGKTNDVNREIPLTWFSHDIGAIIRKRPNEYEDLLWTRDKKKRQSHKLARIYKNKLGECLIINKTGKVEASTGHICNTYGRFCQIANGSRLQLLGIQTGRYLAIDSNSHMYSTTNRSSSDTMFSYVLGNTQTYTALGIYRTKNNKKCFLHVQSNAVTQTCSRSPRYLEPINAGTC